MFGTIRKHQTWLWVIIIIVVVIAFVIYFNPSTRQGQGGPMRSENFGTIAGETITRDKFADANREVYLMFFTRYGDWPDKEAQRTGFNEVRETFYRLLLLKKARELNIHVSDTVVAQLAREILRAFEQAGAGTLAEFEQRILAPRGMQRKDFERFVRNEVAIQELASLIGGSGRLVTPEEARETYAREYEELSTQMVVLSATNYLPAISVSAESVAQFYTNQMPRYRLPERVQVSVVAFPASNHLAAAEAELSATNLNEIVEATCSVWAPITCASPRRWTPPRRRFANKSSITTRSTRRAARLMILLPSCSIRNRSKPGICVPWPRRENCPCKLWRRLIASGARWIWTWA